MGGLKEGNAMNHENKQHLKKILITCQHILMCWAYVHTNQSLVICTKSWQYGNCQQMNPSKPQSICCLWKGCVPGHYLELLCTPSRQVSSYWSQHLRFCIIKFQTANKTNKIVNNWIIIHELKSGIKMHKSNIYSLPVQRVKNLQEKINGYNLKYNMYLLCPHVVAEQTP